MFYTVVEWWLLLVMLWLLNDNTWRRGSFTVRKKSDQVQMNFLGLSKGKMWIKKIYKVRQQPKVISKSNFMFNFIWESYFSPPVKGKSNIHWSFLPGLVGQLLRKRSKSFFFGLLDVGLFSTHLFYSFTALCHFATFKKYTVQLNCGQKAASRELRVLGCCCWFSAGLAAPTSLSQFKELLVFTLKQ